MQDTTTGISDQILGLISTYGLNVVGAIVILVVGWLIAGWLRRIVDRALSRSEKIDMTLRLFLASLTRYAVLVFTGLAVLSQFGIQTASLIAVIGAAGLAIGLALQGTLQDVAAGVLILLFRPFKVGDYVEAGGVAGTVRSITLFVTELATPDNVQVLAPNGQIWGSSVKNYSFHSTRRVDIGIGIAYEDSIDQAIDVIDKVVRGDSRVLEDPPIQIAVGELGDSSVNLIVRAWCQSGDYWSLKFDLTKALKEQLDEAGITIPFPQRMLHLSHGLIQKAGQAAAE